MVKVVSTAVRESSLFPIVARRVRYFRSSWNDLYVSYIRHEVPITLREYVTVSTVAGPLVQPSPPSTSGASASQRTGAGLTAVGDMLPLGSISSDLSTPTCSPEPEG